MKKVFDFFPLDLFFTNFSIPTIFFIQEHTPRYATFGGADPPLCTEIPIRYCIKTHGAFKLTSLYCVLCTVYCVLCTVYCVLCTVYCVLCTCVLCTVYCVLCTVYCVLCTVYCVLCTVYCVLCTVYWSHFKLTSTPLKWSIFFVVKSGELGNPLPLVFEFFYVLSKSRKLQVAKFTIFSGGGGGGFLKIGRMTSVESKKEASHFAKVKCENDPQNRGSSKFPFFPFFPFPLSHFSRCPGLFLNMGSGGSKIQSGTQIFWQIYFVPKTSLFAFLRFTRAVVGSISKIGQFFDHLNF